MTLHPARARSAHVSASAPRRLRWRWPLRNRLDVPTLITTTLCFLGALPTRISPGLTPVGLLLFILECIVREADATTRYCDCGAERAGFSLRPRWPSIFPPGRVRRRRSSESWGRKSREHENGPKGGLNPPRWLAARVGEGAVVVQAVGGDGHQLTAADGAGGRLQLREYGVGVVREARGGERQAPMCYFLSAVVAGASRSIA